MTVVSLDPDGLERVCSALRRGHAAIIPLASPLPYVVAGIDAATVNELKGRAREQPCGMLIGRHEDVAAHLDLDRPTAELSTWIAAVEHASLLVPLLPGAPQWLVSNSADGIVGITLAWLSEARPLADELGHLVVSSANLTSGRVGVTADDVDQIFAGQPLVLDGDRFRDASIAHGSATIIEVRRGGVLRIARDGINNRRFSGDPDAYLDTLRRRFADSRRPGPPSWADAP